MYLHTGDNPYVLVHKYIFKYLTRKYTQVACNYMIWWHFKFWRLTASLRKVAEVLFGLVNVAAELCLVRWPIPVETFMAFVCTSLEMRLQTLHVKLKHFRFWCISWTWSAELVASVSFKWVSEWVSFKCMCHNQPPLTDFVAKISQPGLL